MKIKQHILGFPGFVLLTFYLLIGSPTSAQLTLEQQKAREIKIGTPKPGDHFLLPWWNGDTLLCLLNEVGDTVVNFGKYQFCDNCDTIRDLAFVADMNGAWWGINYKDSVLFGMYAFEPGDPHFFDGLTPITIDGKVGYANEKGEIVIEPQFECAYQFEKGCAKVALKCKNGNSRNHTTWQSDSWFYIDKEGYKVKPGSLHRIPNQE